MQPIVIALGDPAGVGPEVTAGAWEARRSHKLAPFMAVGDAASIQAVWNGPIQRVDSPLQVANCFDSALPVWQVEETVSVTPGCPTPEGAHCALQSLELGVGLARSGEVEAVVTAPICKERMYKIGFTYPGQTEFVADRCGVSRSNAVMMLAAPGLRVVPITTHVPLRDVADIITEDLIVARAQITARGLARNFGIEHPRLALAGFNPHAGENGTIGTEEIEILQPAIERLRAEGIDITGPHSPDALFTPAARQTYDVALCLYHDQALIPLKALYFDEGVNLTLGLPIIRTSPDHGTAFGIAGKGIASSGPMIAAIKTAEVMARHRAALAC